MSELVDLTPDRVHELDRKHVFHSWSAQGSLNPMVITKAEGSYVWDSRVRFAGHSAVST
jgi:taurine--2-oxoglutarate transaminase